MSAPQLSEALAQEAARYYREAGNNVAAAARAAKIPENTMRARIKVCAARGLLDFKPVLPGFRVSQVTTARDAHGNVEHEHIQQKPELGDEFQVPAGHLVKGVSALVDPDGKTLLQWIKTRLDPNGVDIVEAIKSAFKDYKGRARKIAPPRRVDSDLLTLFPSNDWHINLLTWSRETGENWDLKIAEDIIGGCVDDVIERSPRSRLAIILGGGDLLHADTNANRTEASGNVLDADGRHQKGIEVAQRLMIRTIDAALRRHKRVLVRILPGNHDPYSSVAIAYFLSAWYHREPRVTVDLDASLFFWHRFGQVFLGATHGHTVKLKDMPSIMAHRRAEDWGASKFRYIHGFHIHHLSKVATEGNGVICESHQAPVPQDAWHYGAGYLSGRSVQTITYHKNFGEIGRVRTAILDGGKFRR